MYAATAAGAITAAARAAMEGALHDAAALGLVAGAALVLLHRSPTPPVD